jgi:hypothetical protein
MRLPADERSKSGTPRTFSDPATRRETTGCGTPSERAAACTEPSRATATIASSWRGCRSFMILKVYHLKHM